MFFNTLFYYLSITPEQATITPLLGDLPYVLKHHSETSWVGFSNTYPNDF